MCVSVSVAQLGEVAAGGPRSSRLTARGSMGPEDQLGDPFVYVPGWGKMCEGACVSAPATGVGMGLGGSGVSSWGDLGIWGAS